MKKIIAFLSLILTSLPQNGQIVDHNCTHLSTIPLSFINQAKSVLHIAYEHTSHGSQITDGMTGLYQWKGSTYLWNDGGTSGALDIDDYGITGGTDLGNPNWTSWASSTRTYLNNPANSDINVVMWSWCGEVSYATEANINTYLNLMSGLESEFPAVKFVYMTGHLDGTGVNGTLNIRNEQIRNYCKSNNKILYDFADIESFDPDDNYYLNKRANDNCDYDSNGDVTLDKNWATIWQNSHIVNVDWYYCPAAHSKPLNGNRKAYAAWWLFARLAGWSGTSAPIPVQSINVTGEGGRSVITTDDGTLQLNATVLPSYATNKTVTWSITNGSGRASISTSGLVTAIINGTVTATAKANDGSEVSGSLLITLSNQLIPVTDIAVTGENGITTISADDGTLQLSKTILPVNASDNTVTWSVTNGTGVASVSNSGLLTAIANGTVTTTATANDDSGVSGSLVITLSNQFVPVAGITLTGANGATTINTDNGTLLLSTFIAPAYATEHSVTWTVVNGTGMASIDNTGLVTAIANGTVEAFALAKDGSGVSGSIILTLTNQLVPVTGITLTGAGGATTIITDHGTLQLNASIFPVNATNKTLTWSVINRTGIASISTSGLVAAVANGAVTAIATANDGSGVNDSINLTMINQSVRVTGIKVTGANDASTIASDNGTLQLNAAIFPVNATDQSILWTVTNGSGVASISTSGLVTAIANGNITATATANDGSEISGSLILTLTNQIVPVTKIIVAGANGAAGIDADNGTLQLNAEITPVYATAQTVTWSMVNGSGRASIDASGRVTAISDGTVTATAEADDGSGISGSILLTLANQIVPVTSISVAGENGEATIDTDNGTLQLQAFVTPLYSTVQIVVWTIVNGTGIASIDASGKVTAIADGTVTATATANDGSGVSGSLLLTLSNQIISVTGIAVTGEGRSTTIFMGFDATLQLSATIFPANATIKSVTWSIMNNPGHAVINSTGLVTAVSAGTITARATANDGSEIYGDLTILINDSAIPVGSITISGEGGESTIRIDDGTLQLGAAVLPANATDKTVTWSLTNGGGIATISASGLVTAIANGTVTAIASANDGSGISGSFEITMTNQAVLVSGITIRGANGATTIAADNGTLQLAASILPANATDPGIIWSISNGTGVASISSSGRVTAISNGTVTAVATAIDASGVSGSLVLTLSNQVVPVAGIDVTAANGATTITTDNGSLQLTAVVTPVYVSIHTVTWSVVNGTGMASINASGIATAISNGTVTVKATANDGSGISGSLILTLSNQVVPVSSIIVSGANRVTSISSDNGTLQLNAVILPANATDHSITWSVSNNMTLASISTSGLVAAISGGTVTATATANDGSGVSGSIVITLTNQVVPVTGITLTSAVASPIISADNGTLQLNAAILPVNASNKTVTWSIINGTGTASVSTSGLVTAIANGTVTIIAKANDGSEVSGTYPLMLTNQFVNVYQITVRGANGLTAINTDDGTLQLSADILPANASNHSVAWSVTNGTGAASITAAGLVKGVASGTVTAVATANDGSGISGSLVLTLTNQIVPVTGIILTGENGASTITTDNGTLKLEATIVPANATNKSVKWSVMNGTGIAYIDASGLVTAVASGTVTATAAADDGTGVSGSVAITLTNQVVPVTGIIVTGTDGATSITADNGTLQLITAITPLNASNHTVTWSLTNETGMASISTSGLVTSITDGSVRAWATANDGTGIIGTLIITITNQTVPVENISVSGENGVSGLINYDGNLQLVADIQPSYASNQSITWSVTNLTGQAIISKTGFVTAVSSGIVTIKAAANDGSGVYGTMAITIKRNNSDPLFSFISQNELRFPFEDESYLKCKISIYDLNGRLISAKLVESNYCIFDISAFRPGIYIGVLSDQIVLKTGKIIIP